MSAQNTPAGPALSHIEDAFLENIFETSETDLRAELEEEGQSPDEVVARMRTLLHEAEGHCADRKMEAARTNLGSFREGQARTVLPFDPARHRTHLAAMRQGTASVPGMMLAARMGGNMSANDEEGLLEDMADLERLTERLGGNAEE